MAINWKLIDISGSISFSYIVNNEGNVGQEKTEKELFIIVFPLGSYLRSPRKDIVPAILKLIL
jgi:hypothetical protein